MNGQAEEVTYNRKNNLGLEGVSSPFLWPMTHLARFPHIVCQHIELIDDKKWRKSKNLELDFSAQLQIQARTRALAMHRQEQLMALEKRFNAHDTRLVKLHLSVLTCGILTRQYFKSVPKSYGAPNEDTKIRLILLARLERTHPRRTDC